MVLEGVKGICDNSQKLPGCEAFYGARSNYLASVLCLVLLRPLKILGLYSLFGEFSLSSSTLVFCLTRESLLARWSKAVTILTLGIPCRTSRLRLLCLSSLVFCEVMFFSLLSGFSWELSRGGNFLIIMHRLDSDLFCSTLDSKFCFR